MADDPFKRKTSAPKWSKPLVLTKVAIDRIVTNAQTGQTADDKETIAKKEELARRLKASKELSAAMIKAGDAGQKILDRQYAMETASVRLEQDREAKMEARKNAVFDEAYRRLYQNTDRVKYFKAAKNFSEMMKERDMQRAAKASQKDEVEKYDAQFLLGVMRDVDRYHDEELEKEMVKERKKRINAENWTKQHDVILKRKEQEKWNRLRDGCLIRDEDERDKAKAAAKSQRELERQYQYQKMLENQIKDKLVLFDINQQLNDAEELKAKLFNDAKREMTKEHKRIKDQLDKSKDNLRRNVAGQLRDEVAILKVKEEEILQNAVRQAEEKAREAAAIKASKRKEAQEDFQKFYDQEVAAKQRHGHKKLLAGYQERRNINDTVERLQQIEDSKIEKRGAIEKDAQHLQMHQIARKRAEKNEKQMEVLKDYMHHMRSLEEEEEVFQKYAQMEIAKAEARGINTYAMKKAGLPGIECGRGPIFKERGHIRPRYYAAIWNPDDLIHTNRNQNLVDTKTRLGFTY